MYFSNQLQLKVTLLTEEMDFNFLHIKEPRHKQKKGGL